MSTIKSQQSFKKESCSVHFVYADYFEKLINFYITIFDADATKIQKT